VRSWQAPSLAQAQRPGAGGNFSDGVQLEARVSERLEEALKLSERTPSQQVVANSNAEEVLLGEVLSHLTIHKVALKGLAHCCGKALLAEPYVQVALCPMPGIHAKFAGPTLAVNLHPVHNSLNVPLTLLTLSNGLTQPTFQVIQLQLPGSGLSMVFLFELIYATLTNFTQFNPHAVHVALLQLVLLIEPSLELLEVTARSMPLVARLRKKSSQRCSLI